MTKTSDTTDQHEPAGVGVAMNGPAEREQLLAAAIDVVTAAARLTVPTGPDDGVPAAPGWFPTGLA